MLQTTTAEDLATFILCSPTTLNARIDGQSYAVACLVDYCTYLNCDDPGDKDRPSQADIDNTYNDAGDFYRLRHRSMQTLDGEYNDTKLDSRDFLMISDSLYISLEKRANIQLSIVDLSGNSVTTIS